MRILVGYLARAVIMASLVALAAILALDFVFKLVDGVADEGTGATEMLLEAVLTAPSLAYEAFPFATLIGALMGLGGLAARQELTAMRAAGVSVLQIAGAVLVGGVILALLATAVGEYVVPPAERQAAAVRGLSAADELRTGPDGALWARDGRDFLRAERPRSPGHLESVTLYRFAKGRLAERVEAEAAHYRDGAWQLEEVVRVAYGEAGLTRAEQAQWTWQGSLSPEVLAVVVAEPGTLPAPELWTYIRYLEANDLDSGTYRLALWEKLATPLATLAMLLVTIPLVFTAVRSAGAGQRIVIGVLVGVAFFLLNRALGQAGVVYGVPPSLSALLPVVLFAALGLWGTLRVR
ncbi:MAG: LPS export ABC transporter permease LptG [Halomonas sp.]